MVEGIGSAELIGGSRKWRDAAAAAPTGISGCGTS